MLRILNILINFSHVPIEYSPVSVWYGNNRLALFTYIISIYSENSYKKRIHNFYLLLTSPFLCFFSFLSQTFSILPPAHILSLSAFLLLPNPRIPPTHFPSPPHPFPSIPPPISPHSPTPRPSPLFALRVTGRPCRRWFSEC